MPYLVVYPRLWLSEVAQNFKEQGNEYYLGKRYREAIGFYTQGLDAKPTEQNLIEALLCNRAACNLELRESFNNIFCAKVERRFML